MNAKGMKEGENALEREGTRGGGEGDEQKRKAKSGGVA